MEKYKNILLQKIENGKRREEKQQKLRKANGIWNTTYYLKEKSWRSYLKDFVKHVWFLAYAILAFIGAVIILHPESRHIILQIFHLS